MIPFRLEDFFDEHEHRPELINLASSDALPWSVASLRALGILAGDEPLTLAYPNVQERLLPHLMRHCNPPAGIELLPTSGAAEAIALVMHEHADRHKGEDKGCIGIPSPSYGAFHGLAELLGIPSKTYAYHPSRGWAPDFDEMLGLSRQCAALVVTNPHNPTGQVIPADVLGQMAESLAARDGTLIVDEVFRVPGETESAIGFGRHVVVIGSLSKTYGLPGLRLGWVAADQERLKRLRTVQQYLTLTLSAMTVALGAAILQQVEKFSRAALIRDNRRILTDWAAAHDSIVSISAPAGGTTTCLAVDTAVAELELFKRFEKNGVLLVPGSQCFAVSPGIRWFRLGYGTESDRLRDGLERISATLRTLAG
jgi:aspartate/methionine/tyrosine aminotransferase